jgi:hypothetical protein
MDGKIFTKAVCGESAHAQEQDAQKPAVREKNALI